MCGRRSREQAQRADEPAGQRPRERDGKRPERAEQQERLRPQQEGHAGSISCDEDEAQIFLQRHGDGLEIRRRFPTIPCSSPSACSIAAVTLQRPGDRRHGFETLLQRESALRRPIPYPTRRAGRRRAYSARG